MNHTLLYEATALLENITPLKTDCGLLCSGACCEAGSENAGVWLLPGEDECDYPWADTLDSTLPVAGEPVKMIMCREMCERAARPFMCRIFPLTPFFSKKRGVWDVRMDRRAAPVCPLFNYGTKALNPEFTEAVRSAVRLLSEDPDWEKVLIKLQAEEAVYRMEL